jgi:hypothetical protein
MDKRTWDPHNTARMRHEFPEGFIYDCCNQRGTEYENGCEIGPDVAREIRKMKV